MNDTLLRAAVTILGGALAGGLTNTVAIWMLFHPYRPPVVFGRRIRFLHGAVPRSQGRLAAAIGRTVGNQLLTEGDLTRVFGQPEFREAFDAKLEQFLGEVLEVERGSLRDTLGPEIMREADFITREIIEHALAKIGDHIRSEAFAAEVEQRAGKLANLLADEPAGEVLTPERASRIVAATEAWLDRAVDDERFQKTVAGSVRRAADSFLQPGTAIRDLLPQGVSDAVERAVAGYLPLAVARLGSVLKDPVVRRRFEQTMQELLQRFLGDLTFHKRVVAKFVMTEGTVNRIVDTMKVDGAEKITRMLNEPPAQAAMARGIREAVQQLLARPASELLGDRDDPAVAETLEGVTAWIVDVARDPAARAIATGALKERLERASGSTWGELLGSVESSRVSGWLVTAARSEMAESVYREATRRLAAAAFDRPIGRPGRFLPPGAANEGKRMLGDSLWRWLQSQIPAVVRRLDVARQVEEKVVGFPLDRMERLVRRVTERELKTIIRLGYVLGAFVGGLLVAANYFLS